MHGRTIKAIIAIFVAAVFLAGVGIVLNDDVKDVKAGGSGGNTLYVGGSGPNNYTKIQDAVDNASDGDTVYVFNGTYYENVFIGRSINLIGENKDTTIIDGGGSGDVVHITVDWIDICGLTVQNSGSGWNDAGIELDYGTKHCQIENNTASNNSNGIYLESSNNNCTICNNTIYSNGYGLSLASSSNCTICDNIIYSNSEDGGLAILSSSNCTICNNIIYNNSNWYGLYVYSSSNNTIYNNTIANNNWAGLSLQYSNNNIIYNNTITNSSLGLEYSSNNDIYNNTIYNSSIYKSWYALPVYSSSNNTICNNTIYNSGGGGLCLEYSNSSTICNNIIYNNSWEGLNIHSSSNNIITGNIMAGNGIVIEGNSLDNWNTHTIDTSNTINGKPVYYWKNVNGGTVPAGAGQIILANCTGVTVANQNLSNATAGIELGFSSGCIIFSNTASNNKGSGIQLYYSNNCIISNNTAHNNSHGFYLSYSSNCTISNSTVISNKWSGIQLYYSNNCTVFNSTTSNSNYGVCLYYSSNCNIIGNNIGNNNDIGIFLWGDSNCIIIKNTMVENSILILGDTVAQWNTHTIDTSNTINGKPVYYWKNVNGGTVPAGAGQIILANCTGIVIKNQDVKNGSTGIEMGFSHYCTITNSIISNNSRGMYLEHSSRCIISNNTICNNDLGIFIVYSSNCNITENNISNNNCDGIDISVSRNCNITGNVITNSKWDGIYLYSSSKCNIHRNNIYGNKKCGVNNSNSEIEYRVNATYNWWGDKSGPHHETLNPSGAGDKISDNILFEPWLTKSCTNVPPNASFGYSPLNPTDLDIIQFTDSSSDSDGSVVSWSWEFGDGSTSTQQNPTHQYADDGTYLVNLTVTDDDGATDTVQKSIAVSNVPPNADFDYHFRDKRTVVFNDESTDSDGNIVNRTWNFGDGHISYEQNPTHEYAHGGSYTVILTVTDDDGATDSVSKGILIDTVPPWTEIWVDGITGKNDWYISSYVIIAFMAHDSGSGVDYTMYRLDDKDWKKYNSALGIWQNGEHTIEYYSVDNAGNIESINSYSFKIDNKPPEVKVLYPNGGEILNGTVVIEWDATDNIDTDLHVNIKYSDDAGSTWHAIATGESNDGTYEWDTSSMSDGTDYLIKISTSDDAGNIGSDVSDETFTIHNHIALPSVSIVKPRGHLYIEDREIMPLPSNTTIIWGAITIEANAESGTGIEKVEFYVDDELKATLTAEPYSWTWDETAFFTHTIKVIAYDNAGNTATDEQAVWIFNL